MSSHGQRDPKKNMPRAKVVRPGGLFRRPVEPDTVGDRLTVLVHELAGLLDGSMRQVSLVLRDLKPGEPAGVLHRDDHGHAARLRTVHTALEKMAEAIRHASGGAPSPWLQASYALSLADAVRYAVGIMEPAASERGVELTVEMSEALETLPPGHVYSVVINGVRNAIEACAGAGVRDHAAAHEVRVRGWIERRGEGSRSKDWACIEIRDTGIGPPILAHGQAQRVFEPDFSTKPGGLGVGLALSRQIVEGLGGFIELHAREDGTRGSVLKVAYPAMAPSTTEQGTIG
jgi:signal transduction histidine kinase